MFVFASLMSHSMNIVILFMFIIYLLFICYIYIYTSLISFG